MATPLPRRRWCRPAPAATGLASPNPPTGFETAGWLSLLLWSWVGDLMARKGAITADSLWRLLAWDATDSLRGRLATEWAATVAARRPSLRRAFVAAFGGRYLAWSVPAWAKAGFIIAQTQFLALLLDELRTPSSPSGAAAYLYALGLVATGGAAILLHHAYFYHAWRAGLNWRMAATALLFSKSLTLRLDALLATSAGRVINMASSDVERLQKLCQYLTYLAVAPVEGAVVVWLLFREVGVATLAGLAVLVAFVAAQVWASRAFGRLRADTTGITDERVRLTGQVVAGIRVLKMYGWEPPFLRAVRAVRDREMRKVGATACLRGVNEGLFVVVPLIVGGATFLAYWGMGEALTPRKIFVSMSLFALLQIDVCKFVQLGLEAIAEVMVTFDRLQAFLLLPDVAHDAPARDAGADADADAHPEGGAPFAVETHALCASWAPPPPPPAPPAYAVSNVTLAVRAHSLCIVLGAVGAGKTSLLMALLRELAPAAGSVAVRGRVAYASQAPWILSGTLRDNITFGLPYDAARFAAVLDACCLREDVAGFAARELEVIGERGVNLSGGQRARVGLARACYADADVYLLDDPLSAVDARVGRQLAERCINGMLAGKTRVLVTHQLQYLRDAEHIVVLSHGAVVTQGTFEQLAAALAAAELAQDGADGGLGAALAEILRGIDSDDDDGDAASDSDGDGGGGGGGGGDDDAVGVADDATDGGSSSRRRGRHGTAGSLVTAILRRVSAASSGRASRSSSARHAADAVSPATPAVRADRSGEDAGAAAAAAGSGAAETGAATTGAAAAGARLAAPAASLIEAEGMEAGAVTRATYVRYWAAAGRWYTGLYILVVLAAGSVVFTYTGVWLAQWGNLSPAAQREARYPGVYGGLVLASAVLSLWRSVSFFLVALAASRALHDAAFVRVLAAPLAWFDANPAGRVLNRFAKDIGLCDELLPATFFDFSSTALGVLAIVVLVVVVNPWVLLSLPFLVVAFAALRRYYVLTARVIKRMESVTRSPIYSIMNEALTGLPVIRAFGMQRVLTATYDAASDANIRAYIGYLLTSRWLGIRLDAICLALLTVTAFVSVAARAALAPGLVGLLLSQIITLAGAFQWTVRQSTELENQMVSVERCHEYAALPGVEALDLGGGGGGDGGGASSPSPPPPRDWPTAGAVTFTNVYMRYRANLPPVLRGVTVSFAAGTKVGVVGRTGAGKSSLVLALLRLVEPERRHDTAVVVTAGGGSAGGGSAGGATPGDATTPAGGCGIAIDGRDIACVPLSVLRRAVSTIPQDPVLFAGTIRSNVDPFGAYTDAACLAALERCQLAAFVAARGGLAGAVSEGGHDVSVGQRQLLCLARALLRNSRVIVIDEATANIDADTDAAIQHAVRHAFGAATVITIAHRLHTIIDSDAILVLDAGTVAQFGPPAALLAAGSGPFHALVAETGAKTAAALAAAAAAAATARDAADARGVRASDVVLTTPGSAVDAS